jgi:hypothetical protein
MQFQRLVLSLTLGLASSVSASAEPVVHFGFEGEAPLTDTVSGLVMNLRRDARLVDLPAADDPGAHFGSGKQALSFPGEEGHLAVLPNLPPLGGSFSVEALVNLGEQPVRLAYMIAMLGDFAAPSRYSWMLMVRGDGKLESQPRELAIILSDGQQFRQVNSGFVMEADVDYYIGVAVDVEGGTVTFHRQRLDGAHEAEEVVRAHPLKSINDARVLQVGDSLNNVPVAFGGLIDELRITRGALKPSELGWPRKAE